MDPGEAQTHPVCTAEPLHDHCGAKRAGWVHGAAGEVDLDREGHGEEGECVCPLPQGPQLS